MSSTNFYEEPHEEGEDLTALLEPLVLEDIRQVTIYLDLKKEDGVSCQSRMIIGPGATQISTSDKGTGWGAAVHADLERFLQREGMVSSSLWPWKLRSLMKSLMNVFLILAAVLFMLWYIEDHWIFAVGAIGFLLAGAIPLYKDVKIHFKPEKPFQAIIDEPKSNGFSLGYWASILGAFIGSLVSIIELVNSILKLWLGE